MIIIYIDYILLLFIIKSMRIIIAILFIVSISIPCFAEVKFNLKFTDNEGTGFNQKENEWMRTEAEEICKLVGKLIKQNACINIRINATDKTSYAWAPTEHYYVVEEKHAKKIVPKAQNKIINNITIESTDLDGHIEFNIIKFKKEKSREFGLTLMHELTHILGFLNCQDLTAPKISCYSDFDKLLHDKNGNPFLINTGDADGHYFLNPKFDSSLDLYACGKLIRKQNAGQYIKIYNPPIIEKGSSHTHLDSKFHPRSIMTSHKSPDEYQIWNNFELGILQELGYEIDWNNYYEIFNKLYPPVITINLDKTALAQTDTHFEIVVNPDFPQQCCHQYIDNKINDKTISVNINKECQLILVDNVTKSKLFNFNPFCNNYLKEFFVKNKNCKIKLTKNMLNEKEEFNIKFIL